MQNNINAFSPIIKSQKAWKTAWGIETYIKKSKEGYFDKPDRLPYNHNVHYPHENEK